ncbi:hypothetical protein Bca52824_016226 [Brassica carinata]|uniref:C2 domain-containing protein n=1 Tax=Brassica carinata TaxID=52824 RepID=A0A8X7W378_BRACI|nr:hypothetical protein Bca52824_016226 [Brassica carinata]
MSLPAPCQILDLNIISAQELAPVARCMKTYAIAWTDPKHKLTSRVDNTGGTSPTWNDKFVFLLNDEALYDGTSIVVIEIYMLHWFKDIQVGTVQTLISDLVSPSSGMRFVNLEVLRASGRPHGLLNIAVGLIDNSSQSMPLLFEDDLMFHKKNISSKPVGLRRSKSDTSSMVESPRKVRQQTRVSLQTQSDLGPSASVVAAQISKEKALTGRDTESTVISVGEQSVEGLQSKLGRWHANLPVVLGVGSSYQPSSDNKTSSNFNHKSSYKPNETVPRNKQMIIAPLQNQGGRNKKGGDNGLSSCFGNICGIVCSIVYGGSNGQKKIQEEGEK